MVKSIVTYDTIMQNHLDASIKSFNNKMAVFKAMETRYLGVYVEIHVALNEADGERIQPIIMKPEDDEIPVIKGSLTDPLVFSQRLDRFKRLKEAYTKLLKNAFAEGRRIFAAHKGKCKVAIVRKRMPMAE